ncbi:methionyl-tRNA formyltransferase [Mycobacteroides abscessus subsp. massiliense]|nr:methionyl-tRNA formyltransferase [Mycobacteroides abscessus subsp. massiliense]
MPRLGWVNLHLSLLPAWRGAAPVQASIAAGDEITGATTFLIEPALDSGPVYGVVTERISPNDTAGALLVQPQGKKVMNAADWARGARLDAEVRAL